MPGKSPGVQPLEFEPQGELAQPFQKSDACHGPPTSFGVTLRRSHVHSACGRAYRETDEGAADRQTVIAKPAVRPSEVPNREFFWIPGWPRWERSPTQ
jgi:hypothetical protein